MSHVYFIRSGTYVKIGVAGSVRRRLSELQSANPERLELVKTYRGDESLEEAFHRHFLARHVRAEWFHYAGEIEQFLASPSLRFLQSVLVMRDRIFAEKQKRREWGTDCWADGVLSVTAAAALAGVERKHVVSWIGTSLLPHSRPGSGHRKLYVPRRGLIDFLTSRTAEAML